MLFLLAAKERHISSVLKDLEDWFAVPKLAKKHWYLLIGSPQRGRGKERQRQNDLCLALFVVVNGLLVSQCLLGVCCAVFHKKKEAAELTVTLCYISNAVYSAAAVLCWNSRLLLTYGCEVGQTQHSENHRLRLNIQPSEVGKTPNQSFGSHSFINGFPPFYLYIVWFKASQLCSPLCEIKCRSMGSWWKCD